MTKKISIGYCENPLNNAQPKFIPSTISDDPDQSIYKLSQYLIYTNQVIPQHGNQMDVYELEDNGYYVMDIDITVVKALSNFINPSTTKQP